MHITTTTTCSDALEQLIYLDEWLVHANFMPQERVVDAIIRGVMTIEALANETTTDMFNDDEISFVLKLDKRLSEVLNDIVGADLDGTDTYTDNEEYG